MKKSAKQTRKQTPHPAGLAITLFGLLASWLLPVDAHALEFQCNLNADVRYLRMDIPGEEHLCEVSVNYENTGERKVMWYAEHDSLFCSARAYELSEKYENQWGFSCSKWPDHDGVDKLSASQRAILDHQLKQFLNEAQANESLTNVIAVKAATNTLLDQEPGILALQYFFSDGTDITQVIADDKSQWRVFATINDLAAHITGTDTIDSALISSISDGGALEVLTTVATNTSGEACYGRQVLMANEDETLQALSTHRFVCKPDAQSISRND